MGGTRPSRRGPWPAWGCVVNDLGPDKHRVVVTGLGVLAPNGHGKEAFVAALREGKSGIRHHAPLAEAKFACQVGGIPEGVDEIQKSYLTDEELMAMNPN